MRDELVTILIGLAIAIATVASVWRLVSGKRTTTTTDWSPAAESSTALSKEKPQTWTRLGFVAIALAVALILFAGGARWFEAARWDPLGEFPIQVVTVGANAVPSSVATIPGTTGTTQSVVPTIYMNGTLKSTGIKCVADAQILPVTVTGVLSWVSEEPPGQLVEVGRGGGLRGPGCVSYSFTNPIPPQIRELLVALADDGVESSQWHLTGTETPVDTDGTTGVDRVWVSTTFRIVHRDAP